MIDASFSFTFATPATGANGNTNSFEFNPLYANGETSDQWRLGFYEVDVPAYSDLTNSSVTNVITLQDSADNSNFANTNPLIQVQTPGVASTGSAAHTVNVPLPPGVRQYIRFNVACPANGGNGNNAVITFNLRV